MGIFLEEQHAANGLLGNREKTIIFMSFTAAATESWEMFNLLCREADFLFIYFLPHSGTHHLLTEHRAGLRLAEPLLRPSEPECSHTSMSAVTVMRKRTWHFSNPVHCGLPFQLSGTVIEHHFTNFKEELCQGLFLRVEGPCWVPRATGIKLKSPPS